MANTKTKKSVTQKSSKEVEENVNSADIKLEEENASLKKELDDMAADYRKMQLQLQQLLLMQQPREKDDGSCLIGCRIFSGVTLSSNGGDITVPIKYREEVEVSNTELKEIFKNPFKYKNMFKKDSLYFVDEENYKKFNITKEIDLSDENLTKILKESDITKIIDFFRKITNDKKDLTEVFAVIYQIAYLIDKRKIDLDYETRRNIEDYFSVGFSELIKNLNS